MSLAPIFRRKRSLGFLLILSALFASWSAIYHCTTPHVSHYTSSFFKWSSSSVIVPQQPPTGGRRLPNFAFAIKTGKETIEERLSRQFATFLPLINNFIYISDHNETFGTVPVYDCYNPIYTDAWSRLTAQNPPETLRFPPPSNLEEVRKQEPGWERDAHKNLIGFKHLYESFPDADWYFMIDDDTYVFTSNLYDITADLDPEALIHMGVVRGKEHCGSNDDMPEPRHGFYQGGSGILFSRGAMKALYPHLDECIMKSWDCEGGDRRVGLCQYDAGIPVRHWWQNPFAFYSHDFRDLNAEWGWPGDSCLRPITGHRMRKTDFQDAFQAEQEAPSGRVTFADLYAAQRGGYVDDIAPDRNYPGWTDFGGEPLTSALACHELCQSTPQCLAWTWGEVEQFCWLKNDAGGKEERKGYVSGMLGEGYRCGVRGGVDLRRLAGSAKFNRTAFLSGDEDPMIHI
ncbi:hypothetical protein SAICODRAFT_73431 [Saitoella complicata NRRL Y-17804]|uniref:N-acetylgalactosaminide beta-1,3-galactosyltransferase n=1 Tax=Saitoella complicata (strain BCRC 22490 / CBS 7301 / JCM 7358 / NBRC 10748 / NRRL Y-17804) TaxID=698492 RepID=A0A0E9NN75_SAICN|nr:uncharacterized protein SAICODRAFT_73431 [Saitoella complicata NRRL Y-17804]ODQ50384.1 hypothetical protein SAICODRAFT_73431 [Saitoella complicata NRRL Y-17804]GAO51136.1 hypothetical protein G7K_5247-t1 [Saitoella complicata NRRL Y-17804]